MPIALQSNALVDLDLAKIYLKIPTLETSLDDIVKFFINTASDRIEQETRRKIKKQAYTEYHHGRSSNMLLVRQWPIASSPFPQVFLDNSADFAANSEVDADSIRVGDDNNTIVLLGQRIPLGYNNVKVVYTAGYDPVPSDLQNACLWFVSWYHRARDAGDIGRTSKTKGDETISFLQDAPKDIIDVILSYKRTEVPLISSPVANG